MGRTTHKTFVAGFKKKIQNKKTQKKAMGLEKLSEGVKLPQNITILVSHGVSGMAILRTFKSVGWIPLVAIPRPDQPLYGAFGPATQALGNNISEEE